MAGWGRFGKEGKVGGMVRQFPLCKYTCWFRPDQIQCLIMGFQFIRKVYYQAKSALPKEEILWLWPPSVMSDDGVQIRVSIN